MYVQGYLQGSENGRVVTIGNIYKHKVQLYFQCMVVISVIRRGNRLMTNLIT
jgi:hypothetical protein